MSAIIAAKIRFFLRVSIVCAAYPAPLGFGKKQLPENLPRK